ncbi:hypothetical protein [Streptomyces sp. AC495_CC817]|uniref:hypothetical protein n=1 Tax=Streptomyces sp. AC495_CC817 TaxID=2823900 RepID=UPI001C259AAC|nr:hypothetical protein [Streptomyces sp. AC495_CC817]
MRAPRRERSDLLGLLPWPEQVRVARALRTETVGGLVLLTVFFLVAGIERRPARDGLRARQRRSRADPRAVDATLPHLGHLGAHDFLQSPRHLLTTASRPSARSPGRPACFPAPAALVKESP